jgi:hypothetical protein
MALESLTKEQKEYISPTMVEGNKNYKQGIL